MEVIDPVSRAKLGGLIEQFFEGSISNYQFEDQTPQTGDKAVRLIVNALWLLFDDFPEDQLDLADLSFPEKRLAYCCRMFLRTKLPLMDAFRCSESKYWPFECRQSLIECRLEFQQ